MRRTKKHIQRDGEWEWKREREREREREGERETLTQTLNLRSISLLWNTTRSPGIDTWSIPQVKPIGLAQRSYWNGAAPVREPLRHLASFEGEERCGYACENCETISLDRATVDGLRGNPRRRTHPRRPQAPAPLFLIFWKVNKEQRWTHLL